MLSEIRIDECKTECTGLSGASHMVWLRQICQRSSCVRDSKATAGIGK